MNRLAAFACLHLAAYIASRSLQRYDKAIECALLGLYVLRPVVAGDNWTLAKLIMMEELLPSIRAAKGKVPVRAGLAYCREFGAFFHGEYRQSIGLKWIERGLSLMPIKRCDSEQARLGGRLLQHRGFVLLRQKTEAGIRDVQDADERLALSYAPYGAANNALHLTHFFLDSENVPQAEKEFFRLEQILGADDFALVESGNVRSLAEILGGFMATGIVLAYARLEEQKGNTAKAEALYYSFRAACDWYGIINQGAILLADGPDLVPGVRERFAALDSQQIRWLDMNAEQGWKLMGFNPY